jgi:hypothetical protein
LRLFFAGIFIGPPWPVEPAESTALPLRGLRVCMPTAAAARHTCVCCAYMVTGAPGRGTGAGACPRGHCRLAACPGDRILRICSRVLGLIYALRAATHVRRAMRMRSFVTSTSTSVPGPGSGPGIGGHFGENILRQQELPISGRRAAAVLLLLPLYLHGLWLGNWPSAPRAWGDPRWPSQGICIASLASQEEERVKVLKKL